MALFFLHGTLGLGREHVSALGCFLVSRTWLPFVLSLTLSSFLLLLVLIRAHGRHWASQEKEPSLGRCSLRWAARLGEQIRAASGPLLSPSGGALVQ